MSLIKLNDRAVKDVTQFGSISSLGSLTHISTATASASASIEFSLGDYKEYIFYYVNMHPSVDNAFFQFNMSTDNGSNYNVAKTTTFFRAYHYESGQASVFDYRLSEDLAQGTGFQTIQDYLGADNDQSCSGYIHLFNPSSTTFVKHYILNNNGCFGNDISINIFSAGYGNTTSAINSVKFQMSSGNIDDGQILLFGVN
ncbi:hypothetical protein N8561_01435 [bacterium]|nr:hypothetical protein [bacterium]